MPELQREPKSWGFGGCCLCQRQETVVRFGEMGRKRSAMVPAVKDVMGIIFPGIQKALEIPKWWSEA